VVNQKGGCGKTTTAINLAGVFAGRGFRTLLVDMDPQGHCAAGLAIPEQRVDQHIGDAMLAPDDKPIDPQRLLWRVSRNLDLAPSTVRLAALEASRGELAAMADAESRLKKVLKRFDSQYDICLIDCSPAIGMLAFNALVAADEVIIPVETGFFSLQGATKQINAIKAIGKRLGVAPPHRLLATMHDTTSGLSRDLLEELRRRFTNRVIPVVITLDHALREASSFGQPVVEYSRDSQGAKDYQQLAEWLIENTLKAGAGVGRSSQPDDPASGPGAFGSDASLVQVIAGGPEGGSIALAATEAPAGPPISRAADMAQRTRKLQRAVAIAEAKLTPMAETPNLEEASATHDHHAPRAAARQRDPFGAALAPAAEPEPSLREESLSPAPSIAPEPARRMFGVQVTARGVLFIQPLTIGQDVAIAGEFNDWTPARTPLRANPHTGSLEAMVQITPGYSQYRLVVDGRWMPDPFNPVVAPNPFGGSNSVVVVPMGTAGPGGMRGLTR
jgi:chromosome partitioning protein